MEKRKGGREKREAVYARTVWERMRALIIMQLHALKPIYAVFPPQLVICLNSPTVPKALNSAARDFKFLTCGQQRHCNLDQSALSTLHAARSVAALLGLLMGGRNPTQLQSKKDSCTLQLSVVANNS